MLRKLHRVFGQVAVGQIQNLLQIVGRTDVFALVILPHEAVGMGDQLGLRGDFLLNEGCQAARVVVVAVGEHQMGQITQIDAHLPGVAQVHVRISHIQEDAGIPLLHIAGKGGFAEEILVDVGVVVAEDAQFHRFASCNSPWKNTRAVISNASAVAAVFSSV